MNYKLCATIVGIGLSLGSISKAAPGVVDRSFEHGLRRAVLIKGEEQRRFGLSERMNHYRVPGLSVAVIDKCRIVEARGFGESAGNGPAITRKTLFQAGSISKSVTAVAALKLVSQGTLSPDGDIRPILKQWKVRYSATVAPTPLTLRQLLNHTAGLNEVGGKGYPRGISLPTLTQILDGVPPANTPPILVEKMPGTAWLYSSGGYYVVQALMIDAAGMPFTKLIERLVLEPAGMKDSSFAQPLRATKRRIAARAVGPNGSPLADGWLVNPELAAGGMWTNPSDLARLIIALARADRGEDDDLLDTRAAGLMMTRGLNNWGLGVDLGPPGGPRRFGHTGHNTGFVSEYVMYPDSCQGAVVMTNADQGGWLVSEVLRAIGDAYGWPDRRASLVQAAIPVTAEIAERFVGTYQLRDFPSERFAVSRRPDGGLYWARLGHVGRDLLPESDGRLFSPDSMTTLQADDSTSIRASSLELSFGGGKNIADRID
jgi:CubicO group peptidase (beta-lactamase class C family)